MLVQTARVEACSGDRVVVSVSPCAACSRCASGQGCGFGLGDPASAGTRRLTLTLPPGMQAEPGEEVTVTLAESDLTRAALIAYGIPGAGLIAGALCAAVLGLSEPTAVTASVVGFAVGVALARWVAGRLRPRCEPRLSTLPAGDDRHA